jgi:hypothetical protein
MNKQSKHIEKARLLSWKNHLMQNIFIIILLNICFVQFVQSQNNSAIIPDSIKKVLLNKPDCDTLILVTEESIHHINSPYQLTFLNEIPKTRLDTLVNKLVNLLNAGDQDLTFNYSYQKDLFDSIGNLRTKEAFCFLYILCELSFDEWTDKPIKQGALGSSECFIALNKYFLNNEINTSTNQNYNWDIRELYAKNPPTVYYCAPIDSEEKYLRFAGLVNTEIYDSELIKIINRYSDLREFGGFVEYKSALDTILKEVNKLEYVVDAYFDNCQEKTAIYPGSSTLGVKLMINGKSIEKCYEIQVGDYSIKKGFLGRNVENTGNFDKLIYKKNYIKRGFIDHQRELCNPIPKREDLWKVNFPKASTIVFKDTIGEFLVDSLFNDLGEITYRNKSIIKYFKYIGDDTIHLVNINDDPHFITEFTDYNLVKNQVYQFNVIFNFNSINDKFNSSMGFQLSNGEKIMFEFTGAYISQE